MNPASEYLIRKNIAKELLQIPCSLFLFHKEDLSKLVITISEEFKKSEYYSVKHWNLECCSSSQALPPMTEFRVVKNKIFSDERVILKSYSTIGYQYDDIPSEENSFRQPMSKELYSFYFLHTLEGMKHDRVKSAWLWNHFVRIYLPKLHQSNLNLSRFSLNKNTTDEDQRRLVSEYMKKEWKYWKLWQNFMLLNSAEFCFIKEYQ